MRGRGRSYVAALLLGSAACAHAKCDKVEIEVLPFDLVEDYSRTYKDLGKMGIGSEVGLVRTTSIVEVLGCTATVGYRAPALYIASELVADPCAFEHVKAHELEHVAIYLAALSTLRARIEARVAEGQDLFEAAKAEVLGVRAQHAAFDTNAEQKTNATACYGMIIKLAMHL